MPLAVKHCMLTFAEMLNSLKWPSITCLQMMYKIIHGIVDLKLPDYITFNSNITRGHNYRLTIPPQRIDAYKFSFFPSTITQWNRLLNADLCLLCTWIHNSKVHFSLKRSSVMWFSVWAQHTLMYVFNLRFHSATDITN